MDVDITLFNVVVSFIDYHIIILLHLQIQFPICFCCVPEFVIACFQ